MRNDDFIGKNFYWFTGEVEDIKDPRKMGRVRVRCHGYHGGHPSQSSANFNGVTSADLYTADLPWATVMMPSTSQSSKGFGRTHELEVGSWVVGFFRDGMSAQDPLIMGSIATQTSSSYLKTQSTNVDGTISVRPFSLTVKVYDILPEVPDSLDEPVASSKYGSG